MPTTRANSAVGRSRVIRLVVLVCSVVMLGDSCSRVKSSIGFVGPLTGPSSAVGLGARNGFLMAMGHGRGAAKGKIGTPRIIVMDDRNDRNVCLSAFKALKDQGCDYVVLGTTSQAAEKAIPWAIAENMLVISPTVSNSVFSGADDLFLRVNDSSESYGVHLAEVARRRYGIASAGIIGDSRNQKYCEAVFGAFERRYAELGGSVAFAFTFDAAEGVPEERVVRELRASGAGALVVVAASTEAALTAKYLEKAGLQVQLLFPPWSLTLDLIKNGGTAVEGAVAVSIADLDFRSSGGKEFRKAYLEEYGEEPSFTAIFGWEAAAVLREALSRTYTPTPAGVKDAVLGIGTFRGLQGNIVFDAKGDASRTQFLFIIKDGTFVRLE